MARPTSAWQQARLDAEAARGLYGGNRWNGTQWVKPDGSPIQRAATLPNPFGPKGSLSKTLDKQLQREINKAVAPKLSRDQLNSAAKAHKTLVADTPSECFESVSFKDGLCTCVFARDGYIWEQSMDVDDFLDLFGSGDSLGVAWNEAYHGVPSE
jgi:hypothetical protein